MYTVAKLTVSLSVEKTCPEILPVILLANRFDVISKEISSRNSFVALILQFPNFVLQISNENENLAIAIIGYFEYMSQLDG